ncbi:DUF3040 domain-containing protein [Intrasporangium calvum]|uniref:DUF3040 domain-containing protein n=1 Tax=Intrasporangium calvum TaxID=53358 RepID=A0ABT5GHW7_9MICO|nr:DUF3040 domain-containing protein [Intrasporangium calvum]MDC5697844.1 DUF3040 domain-containing protein [Intrasporangium calvum]
MALSEHEEALLQQMEEALYAEDPRFASRIEKTKSRALGRGRIVVGVAAGVVGLALIIFAAMSSNIWLGAVGFAAMVAGIVWAITPAKQPLRSVSPEGEVAAPRKKAKGGAAGGKSGSFMDRLEQRWDKRRHDQW